MAAKASLKGLWLIVECPHCHSPQVVNRWIGAEMGMYGFEAVRPRECEQCEQPYDMPPIADWSWYPGEPVRKA